MAKGGSGGGGKASCAKRRFRRDEVRSTLPNGKSGRGYPYEGNYSTFLEKKRARLAIQEKAESALA